MARPLIVDGGLATGLEARGHTLHPWLWSAGVFLRNPAAVEEVHRTYLSSGAEILISASYQMTFDGLARAGLDRSESERAMRETVTVARRARQRCAPQAIVAASIGPYGAMLADGSEYSGDYGLGPDALREFHRERFDVLCAAGADLLAVETIPSLDEVRALRRLLSEQQRMQAWLSCSCRDARSLRDGTKISEVARLLDGVPQVKAIGVNCTAPVHVEGLMDEIRSVSTKPIVVYPNSGERWDASTRRWGGPASGQDLPLLARRWAGKGAWAIGGCCRVGPDEIREIAASLRS